jgi:hypothetical protein
MGVNAPLVAVGYPGWRHRVLTPVTTMPLFL